MNDCGVCLLTARAAKSKGRPGLNCYLLIVFWAASLRATLAANRAAKVFGGEQLAALRSALLEAGQSVYQIVQTWLLERCLSGARVPQTSTGRWRVVVVCPRSTALQVFLALLSARLCGHR